MATTAAKQPLWRWLTIFEIEHGPLYYASELAGRCIPNIEASARLASALFGIATVVLGWFTARAITTRPTTPYIFTLLLAASPLHVYYSREGRSYGLVCLIAAALLLALLRGSGNRVIGGLLLLGFYSTAAVAPVIISAAVAAALAALMHRQWIVVEDGRGIAGVHGGHWVVLSPDPGHRSPRVPRFRPDIHSGVVGVVFGGGARHIASSSSGIRLRAAGGDRHHRSHPA